MAEKFKYPDICAIRDAAIRKFVSYPTRARIDGMIVDLDDSDRRALAFFEASIEVANRLGLIDSTKLDAVMPRIYTEIQEVIDEQTYGQTFTPQKK
jgi:hypothetical protein